MTSKVVKENLVILIQKLVGIASVSSVQLIRDNNNSIHVDRTDVLRENLHRLTEHVKHVMTSQFQH